MELFDLYNPDRIPLGTTMIRGDVQPENSYRLVVHCCIFNSDGQMLIQRRQDFKEGYSGMWDISCGGSVIKGENSQTAIHRELLEELGVDIDFSDIRPKLTVHFDGGFNDIYTVIKDVKLSELTLQYEEVAEATFADLSEISNLIDSGKFIPYSKELISLLFEIRDKRGCLR